MLSIFLSEPVGDYIKRTEVDWWVGNSEPISFHDINHVLSIQIDGDELEHVKDQYTSANTGLKLPIPRNQRVVRLFGDIAKTIVANL